jgi:hypothetical protein
MMQPYSDSSIQGTDYRLTIEQVHSWAKAYLVLGETSTRREGRMHGCMECMDGNLDKDG